MSTQEQERIRGVFSLQETRKVGTGTTTRKTVMKTFWYVDQDEETGELNIQSLNNKYIPMGGKKPIQREELLAKYAPEMEFYVQTVFPKIKELNDSLNEGDEHREKGETFSAEFEYANALTLDEENVRANFGIGLTYLEQGDKAKAENIFDRLVTLEAAFTPEHKHLFNDFGISLRKSKMYGKALEFYERALSLGQGDANLFLNIARVELEQKQYPKCLDNIKQTLALEPDNDVAMKMMTWLVSKKFITQAQLDKTVKDATKIKPAAAAPVAAGGGAAESAGDEFF